MRSKRQAVIAVEGALPTACHEKPSSFDEARAANKTTYAGAKFPSDQLKTVSYLSQITTHGRSPYRS